MNLFLFISVSNIDLLTTTEITFILPNPEQIKLIKWENFVENLKQSKEDSIDFIQESGKEGSIKIDKNHVHFNMRGSSNDKLFPFLKEQKYRSVKPEKNSLMKWKLSLKLCKIK